MGAASLSQHLEEINENRRVWAEKEVLRKVYEDLYTRLLQCLDPRDAVVTVELGSGIGNLKAYLPRAITSDIFSHSWIDVSGNAYALPFRDASVTNLVLFDVFHHLERPRAFLKEAERVLTSDGRIVLMEPFISVMSSPIYGLLHHEPINFRQKISTSEERPQLETYYAAQGNATRMFFGKSRSALPTGWGVTHAEAFSCFAYLLSGGFGKRSFYPKNFHKPISSIDRLLSKAPRVFAGRCLVTLTRTQTQ